MDRDEALALLQSGNQRQRLEAARLLRRERRAEDRETLSKALRRENVEMVRRVIQETIDALTPPEIANDEGLAARDAAARAVKETTSKVVHEVRRLLPPMRLAAERDIPAFERSETKTYVDRLDSLIEAIDRLGRAASAPVITDFDLAELVDEIVERETNGAIVPVLKQGPAPMLVLADRDHMSLVVGNGLRNAVESSLQASQTDPPTVVVAWDQTDSQYWLVVLDRGVGLPVGSHHAFDFGRTTKSKHHGAGLAIAKQAIDAMGGEIKLSPRDGGGASYEVTWLRATV